MEKLRFICHAATLLMTKNECSNMVIIKIYRKNRKQSIDTANLRASSCPLPPVPPPPPLLTPNHQPPGSHLPVTVSLMQCVGLPKSPSFIAHVPHRTLQCLTIHRLAIPMHQSHVPAAQAGLPSGARPADPPSRGPLTFPGEMWAP